MSNNGRPMVVKKQVKNKLEIKFLDMNNYSTNTYYICSFSFEFRYPVAF